MEGRLQVFAGSSHPRLVQDILTELDLPLGRAIVGKWRNGETRVKLEESVRGSDVYVVQSFHEPIDYHIMEMLLMIDALRRASAARITAVIPYFAYARQEKKTAGREPISAKVVANVIMSAGVDRVLAVDLHAPAIEGFFDIPVDHLRATPLLARRFRAAATVPVVAVSPDAGGVTRAEEFRSRIGGSLAIISKRRPSPDTPEILEMVGDVDGKATVIVDDMVSTGGTLTEAAQLLTDRGATEIFAAATHGIFAGDSIERISASAIQQMFIADTIPLPKEPSAGYFQVVTVAPLIAEAIMRIHKDLSVSALFS